MGETSMVWGIRNPLAKSNAINAIKILTKAVAEM
jgi:hypothetical protein